MVTVAIGGGLGNQMFQYAAGRALSLRTGSDLRLDPLELLDPKRRRRAAKRPYAMPTVFNIDPKLVLPAQFFRTVKVPYVPAIIGRFWGPALGKLGVWRYYRQQNATSFEPEMMALKGNVYIHGLWMSEDYFKDYEDVIRKDFEFREKLTGPSAALQEEIMRVKSVAIHVRRNDRVWGGDASFFIMGTQEYYDKCLAVLREKIGTDFKLFIFSDSTDWCRKNLKFNEPHMFVGDEYAGALGGGHFQLMSSCKHFALPESTFSWWAAWLCKYKDKTIIVPKKLYNDPTLDTSHVHPEGWIKV